MSKPATPAKPAAAKTAPTKAVPAKRPAKAPAKAPAASKAAAPAKSTLKLVRDSFTMPQQDFDLIAALKKRALALQRPAKKSELLRAGLQALHRLPDESLLASLEGLVQLKPGRPKKGA